MSYGKPFKPGVVGVAGMMDNVCFGCAAIAVHVLRAMLSRIQDFLNYPGAPECFVPE